MKNTQYVVVCLLLCFALAAQAQNETPKIKITDAYILTGVQTVPQLAASTADMRTLAPQSVLLQQDYTGYESYSYNGYSGNGQVAFRMGLQSIKKPNRELQLGVSFGSGMQASNTLSFTTSTPYDTFTSSQTGEQIIVDSVYNKHVISNYRTDQLQLDASLIYRTDHSARWSFYGGIGASVGTSLRATTSIYSYGTSSANTILTSEDAYSYSFANSTFEQGEREEFNNKNVFNASVFIPAGIDFRIGKRNEFWQQLHLVYELRPNVGVVAIPELDATVSAGIQNNVGLRLHW